MQFTVSIPTYGQVAKHLRRSSPGLQTKHKLACYLMQKDIMALEGCTKATIRNKAIHVKCDTDDPEHLREALDRIARETFSEVLGIDLRIFFNGDPYIS